MRRSTAFIIATILATSIAVAQQETDNAPPDRVTVAANGTDVREVLHSIFTQVEKSFIVEVGLYLRLYLNLNEVPFDIAVNVICRNVGMDFKVEDGIYTFFKPRNAGAQVMQQTNVAQNRTATGPLDQSVLNRLLTTRLDQADIRKVAEELSKQTNVPIEVAPAVKSLKVNATLLNTSLRFALNSITQAAKLEYSFTNHGTILISDPAARTTPPPPTQTQTAACDQCNTQIQRGWTYCPSCGNYVKDKA